MRVGQFLPPLILSLVVADGTEHGQARWRQLVRDGRINVQGVQRGRMAKSGRVTEIERVGSQAVFSLGPRRRYLASPVRACARTRLTPSGRVNAPYAGGCHSNFCKNILLEDCTLNRMDTHMGVSGSYIIRRCTLGHAGLNAIGRGLLLVEDSVLCGSSLVNFRGDYGSTWEGDVAIRNCRWIPSCGSTSRPQMFYVGNDGTHDFGYDCYMPRRSRSTACMSMTRIIPKTTLGCSSSAIPAATIRPTPPSRTPAARN